MKKILLIILFLFYGCAHFRQYECPPEIIKYPQKCIISIKTNDKSDIEILEMIRDVCGVREENKCYIINILSEKEFFGWKFICF